LAFFFILKYH